MTVRIPVAQTFAVNLRIPAWAKAARVAVNGKRIDGSVQAGTFAAIHREWRNGDRIELELPRPLRLQPVDAEHPDTVALLAGPLVLMRIDGDAAATSLSREALLSARQGKREWRIGEGSQAIVLRAFADIGDETYSTYHDVA
jgi:hypothetical protein